MLGNCAVVEGTADGTSVVSLSTFRTQLSSVMSERAAASLSVSVFLPALLSSTLSFSTVLR